MARYAVVAARFNAREAEGLLAGCLASLKAAGVREDRVRVVRVPGAFELPLAAQALAKTGRHDAVICLGAVIRGDTAHFDLVARECARGIARVALETGIPIIFGVVTANTPAQAAARCAWPSPRPSRGRRSRPRGRGRTGKMIRNRGEEAAEAAVAMASLLTAGLKAPPIHAGLKAPPIHKEASDGRSTQSPGLRAADSVRR